MLCSACDAIRTGRDKPWYYFQEDDRRVAAYQHHPTPAYLREAADGGCHICLIIWRKLAGDEQSALDKTWRSWFLHCLSESYQRLWAMPTTHYSWSPMWVSGGSDDRSLKIRFQFGDAPFWKKIVFRLLPTEEVEEVDDDSLDRRLKFPGSPTDVGPDQASASMPMWTASVQRLVQRWEADCTSTHRHCLGRHPPTGFQPHRILDLSDNKIRLDVDPDRRASKPYATLTHRWPDDASTMPRLTNKNLDEWQNKEISIDILTATFRDAVQVVRRLGIRFLWIDSLCIQQDGVGHELDWQRESVVMGEIYRNASLNIQAGRDSQHWDYGLFNSPDVRVVEPYPLRLSRTFLRPMTSAQSPNPEVSVDGTFLIIEEDFARDELLGNPINRRGWVLQERLLSPRILHFGAQQVFWECRECLACETFPKGVPKVIPNTMARAETTITKTPTFDYANESLTLRVRRRMTASDRQPATYSSCASALVAQHLPLPSFGSLSAHRDLFAWFYLTELYSACSLTFTDDKLVAISGLAQIFGSPAFQQKAADVVAHLRTLALPRSGGAVSDINFKDLNKHVAAHHAHIGSRPRGDYLAGLWRMELIPCLLWHVANGRQVDGSLSQRLSSSKRAPNWSWASINGLINASIYQNWAQGIYGTVLAEPSDARTTPVYESNVWGQVSDGMIRMHGKVVHEADLIWPGRAKLDQLARGKGMRAHKSALTAHMVRKIRRNVPSVARVGVLKADALCYVDDVQEFVHELHHSGTKHEIGLFPLVGLQRRRPDWGKPEGYTDEIFEWHGLVVKLCKSPAKSQMKKMSKSNSSSLDLSLQQSSDTDEEEQVSKALRLGYFRVKDTRLFKMILDKTEEREIILL
ncbi:hypothetical protein DV738_g3032, partial [Chaetothyriales sp. CBS 135597]